MKTMDFHDFHETLGYSQTTRASKIFSENVLGIGNHSNMSRKSIPDGFTIDMIPKPSSKTHEKSRKSPKSIDLQWNPLIFNENHGFSRFS